jgi:hypothetical protein
MPEEKEMKVREWNSHITWAMKEREYYRFLSKKIFLKVAIYQHIY